MPSMSARVQERVKQAGLGLLALALCACASNGDWHPETKPWVRYNLQFVEGKKFIATWVRPFGRERTNREDILWSDFQEFQLQGLEYAFYEGDYGADGTLRRIGNHITRQKLEITATADSLILAEFTADSGANMFWLDRRTGQVGKELKRISMGPYRLGEFQMRLYQAGREVVAPILDNERILLSSVRPWGEGAYLLDLGNPATHNRAAGPVTDFTRPNEFAPQPFILLDTRSNTFSPFNPDSVFGIGPKTWVEVWRSEGRPIAVHAAVEAKALVLVEGGLESDTLPFAEMLLDSLNLARFTLSDSRGSLEVALTWSAWFDFPLAGSRFGAGVKRGRRIAPDGETEWDFFTDFPIEFVNPETGSKTTYAEPAD